MSKQPFEEYPKLAECLLHSANHWKVDMTNWNKLLSEINKVCRVVNNQEQYLQHRLKQLQENRDIPFTKRGPKIREVKKQLERLNILTANIKKPKQ